MSGEDAQDLLALGFEAVGWISPQIFALDEIEPPCDVAFSDERPDRRADRLAHARDQGQQVCPSCGYDHPATARDDKGRLLPVPCVIETDIWQAVVDVARGQGGG